MGLECEWSWMFTRVEWEENFGLSIVVVKYLFKESRR